MLHLRQGVALHLAFLINFRITSLSGSIQLVTTLWLRRPGNRGSTTGRGTGSSRLHRTQTQCKAHIKGKGSNDYGPLSTV